jgi:hypothetical protein
MINVGDDAEIAYVCHVHPLYLLIFPLTLDLNLKSRARQDNRNAIEEKEICRLKRQSGKANFPAMP